MKMKEIKVAIVGSRTFNSYDDVNTVMSTFISSNDVTVTEIVLLDTLFDVNVIEDDPCAVPCTVTV